VVVVPVDSVTINGNQTLAWTETDPATGHTIGVLEDGTHGAITETAILGVEVVVLVRVLIQAGLALAANFDALLLAKAYQTCRAGTPYTPVPGKDPCILILIKAKIPVYNFYKLLDGVLQLGSDIADKVFIPSLKLYLSGFGFRPSLPADPPLPGVL